MEQKTIGKFITALRKASGMTQKDLAEKLNVSDKTISRWERDEGTPDLSLIPVIAEIFGVTCDELLRGERKPEAKRETDEPTPKGEKQRQRILKLSLSKYRTRSFISIGISAVGLIAAMIGNLGFNRAYIGFLVGAVFFVASLVCQAIFVNGAFLSISDEELAGVEIDDFKNTVIDLTRRTVCITLTLFGATVPLIVFPNDTYWGLEFWSWLISGAVFAAGLRLICGIVWYFVHASLLRRGICTLSEGEALGYWKKHHLKRRCASVLLILLVVTFIAQFVVNEVWGAWNLAKGTEFYDYDSFVAFMEQDVPYLYEDGSAVSVEPPDGIYYDEYGNEITEEEAWREELVISDGSPEGKVVCTFIRRNNSVVSWSTSDTEDGLPITVKTQADYDAAEVKSNLINIGFVAMYLAELTGTVMIYRRKRRNLC